MSESEDDEIYLEALKEKARQILSIPKVKETSPIKDDLVDEPLPSKKVKKPTKKDLTDDRRKETLERLKLLREKSREAKGIKVNKDVKPKRVYTKVEEEKEIVKDVPKIQQQQQQPQIPEPLKPKQQLYYVPTNRFNMKTFGYNLLN